ncbi:MAG: hypothetical protein KF833_19430 [Verrucomicrobiae bacterium]|nr:hypothetical protein [Verrucomicrobiae bacterium]
MPEVLMILGFMLAAYAVVGNDSIQTLGTFLYSNSHRPWWTLWLFTGSVMVVVVFHGWHRNDGEPSYRRLNTLYEKAVPLGESRRALDLAVDALARDPEQVRVLGELRDLDAELARARDTFIHRPEGIDAALVELDRALDLVRSELEALDVIHPQKVALTQVVSSVEAARNRMSERRDVDQYIDWTYLLPPIALFLLTRMGFPVSTSFLVLITFQPEVLGSMLTKSLMGYLIAFVSAVLAYSLAFRTLEARWRREGEAGIRPVWVGLQWTSTAFLWSMWLVQDMANIFVYLPRRPSWSWMLFAVAWMLGVQAFIYATRGGRIQKVVTSKTNTHDIRSATIVDLIYGIVLFIFKVWSNVPMSTTWVFLGLLAGREIAFASARDAVNPLQRALKLGRKDLVKAGFGLGVSVAMAYLINHL